MQREPDPRAEAARILLRVAGGRALAGRLIERRESAFQDARDAALLHELVLGSLRRQAALDHAIGRASTRPPGSIDSAVLVVLRLGAYQLLHLDRVPDHAAVGTSVELARRVRPRATGFVNAVLRRVAREGRALLPPSAGRGETRALALEHSHPEWWTERLVDRFGWERAAEILVQDNEPAPAVLRVAAGASREAIARELAAEGIATAPGRLAPAALRVTGGRIARSAVVARGLALPQDEASQLVTELLDDPVGPELLDLCAAPGTKTLQLAERLPPRGRLVACDSSPARAERLRRRLAASGQDVPVLVLDAAGGKLPLSRIFDDVLVDAPCSGTGTLRRHPEIRWRLRPEDVARHAERQARLLEASARHVRPGGRLVYSVCSLEPEEGEERIARFLERHAEFERLPAPRLPAELRAPAGGLAALPGRDGNDGFFAVALRRRCPGT